MIKSLKSQQRFKSECNNVYTKQINKISLSSNDDRRLQTFDKIITYSYGMQQNANVSFKETIIIKLTILMITQIKTKHSRPQSGHIF